MGNVISRKQKVFNTPDNPLYVVYEERGDVKHLPVSQNLLSGASSTILTLTVPVGKVIELDCLQGSGDGFALYDVKINGTSTFKTRTYYTEYNTIIMLGNRKLLETEEIELEITNRSGSSCDFDATLTYRIYNA